MPTGHKAYYVRKSVKRNDGLASSLASDQVSSQTLPKNQNKQRRSPKSRAMIHGSNKVNRSEDNLRKYHEYYMNMIYLGTITKLPNGGKCGLIHINGESPDYTIEFQWKDIFHIYRKQIKSKKPKELPLKIACQIKQMKGKRKVDSIRIHRNDDSYSRGIGIVKMVATPEIKGILFWESADSVLRFEYKDRAMSCTVDQFVQFEVERRAQRTWQRTNQRTACKVIPIQILSEALVQSVCLNQIGQCHVNSAYFVAESEIDLREDRYHEFKSYVVDLKYGNDIKRLVHLICRNINAFVNSKGGILLVGVNDHGIIHGVPNLSREVEDDIKKSVDHDLRKWRPTLRRTRALSRAYTVEFVSVVKKFPNAGYCVLPDTKVIYVSVKPIYRNYRYQGVSKLQIIFQMAREKGNKDDHEDDSIIWQRNDASIMKRGEDKGSITYKRDTQIVSEDKLEFVLRNNVQIRNDISAALDAQLVPASGHDGEQHKVATQDQNPSQLTTNANVVSTSPSQTASAKPTGDPAAAVDNANVAQISNDEGNMGDASPSNQQHIIKHQAMIRLPEVLRAIQSSSPSASLPRSPNAPPLLPSEQHLANIEEKALSGMKLAVCKQNEIEIQKQKSEPANVIQKRSHSCQNKSTQTMMIESPQLTRPKVTPSQIQSPNLSVHSNASSDVDGLRPDESPPEKEKEKKQPRNRPRDQRREAYHKRNAEQSQNDEQRKDKSSKSAKSKWQKVHKANEEEKMDPLNLDEEKEECIGANNEPTPAHPTPSKSKKGGKANKKKSSSTTVLPESIIMKWLFDESWTTKQSKELLQQLSAVEWETPNVAAVELDKFTHSALVKAGQTLILPYDIYEFAVKMKQFVSKLDNVRIKFAAKIRGAKNSHDDLVNMNEKDTIVLEEIFNGSLIHACNTLLSSQYDFIIESGMAWEVSEQFKLLMTIIGELRNQMLLSDPLIYGSINRMVPESKEDAEPILIEALCVLLKTCGENLPFQDHIARCIRTTKKYIPEDDVTTRAILKELQRLIKNGWERNNGQWDENDDDDDESVDLSESWKDLAKSEMAHIFLSGIVKEIPIGFIRDQVDSAEKMQHVLGLLFRGAVQTKHALKRYVDMCYNLAISCGELELEWMPKDPDNDEEDEQVISNILRELMVWECEDLCESYSDEIDDKYVDPSLSEYRDPEWVKQRENELKDLKQKYVRMIKLIAELFKMELLYMDSNEMFERILPELEEDSDVRPIDVEALYYLSVACGPQFEAEAYDTIEKQVAVMDQQANAGCFKIRTVFIINKLKEMINRKNDSKTSDEDVQKSEEDEEQTDWRSLTEVD